MPDPNRSEHPDDELVGFYADPVDEDGNVIHHSALRDHACLGDGSDSDGEDPGVGDGHAARRAHLQDRRRLMGQTERSGSMIHLPSALVGEFPGLSRSHARRLIVQGAVRLNGVVVTDLEVDLDTIPGDPVKFEVGRNLTSEALLAILEANQEAIGRGE